MCIFYEKFSKLTNLCIAIVIWIEKLFKIRKPLYQKLGKERLRLLHNTRLVFNKTIFIILMNSEAFAKFVTLALVK